MRITLFSGLVLLALACLSSGAAEKAENTGTRATFVCTARSLTGRRYSATGTDQVLTQEAAMQSCENQSFRCYPTGCQED